MYTELVSKLTARGLIWDSVTTLYRGDFRYDWTQRVWNSLTWSMLNLRYCCLARWTVCGGRCSDTIVVNLFGLWRRYATLQNLIPSFPLIALCPRPALHPCAIQGKEVLYVAPGSQYSQFHLLMCTLLCMSISSRSTLESILGFTPLLTAHVHSRIGQ